MQNFERKPQDPKKILGIGEVALYEKRLMERINPDNMDYYYTPVIIDKYTKYSKYSTQELVFWATELGELEWVEYFLDIVGDDLYEEAWHILFKAYAVEQLLRSKDLDKDAKKKIREEQAPVPSLAEKMDLLASRNIFPYWDLADMNKDEDLMRLFGKYGKTVKDGSIVDL